MDRNFIEQAERVPDFYGDRALAVLIQTAESGAKRYFGKIDGDMRGRLTHEFALIRATNTAKLFLYWAYAAATVKRKTYPYVSGIQNCSLVSCCLGITKVNPMRTGSRFERLLNGQSTRIPALCIEVPKGKREEVWEALARERADMVEIRENDEYPDIPAEDMEAFFKNQKYDDREILRAAAESLRFAGQKGTPSSIGDLAELVVLKRYSLFTEEKPALLYQEDVVGLLEDAGFSCEEAEVLRRVLSKKCRTEINFYRNILLQTARAAGRSVEEAAAAFNTLEREAGRTFCRASAPAEAQYLYAQIFVRKNEKR